jgi:hypothetical protein
MTVHPKSTVTLRKAIDGAAEIWVTETAEEVVAAVAKGIEEKTPLIPLGRIRGMERVPLFTDPKNVVNVEEQKQ